MKKNLMKIFIFCLMLFVPFGIVGCTIEDVPVVESFEFVNAETEYEVGDALTIDGLKLKLTMTDGTVIEYQVDETMITLPDMSTPGEKKVVVTYGGKQYSFDITVTEPELSVDPSEVLNKFISDYLNSNGVTDVNIKLTADLLTNYLNEKGEVNTELFNEIITKVDVENTDSLLLVLYETITDSIINESLSVEDLNIAGEKVTAIINLVNVLNSLEEPLVEFNYVDYIFDYLMPEGTAVYVDSIVDTLEPVYELTLSGKVELNKTFTLAINKFRKSYQFDGLKLVNDFNTIIQDDKYAKNEYNKGVTQNITDLVNNASDGEKHALSIYLKANLELLSEDLVIPEYNGSIITAQEIKEISDKYKTNIVDLVEAFEDFDVEDPVSSVAAIVAQMNKVVENYSEAHEKEAYIISAVFGPYEEEFLRASKLVLAEYTGNIYADLVRLIENNGWVEYVFGFASNSENLNTLVSTFVYDVLKGEEITLENYKQLIAQLGPEIGFSQGQMNSYIDQIVNYNYCTIISDYVFTLKAEAVEGFMQTFNISEEDAIDMFNDIYMYYLKLEKLHVSLNIAEPLYYYNAYITKMFNAYINDKYSDPEPAAEEGEADSIVSTAYDQFIEMVIPFIIELTKVDFDGETYIFNLNENIATIANQVLEMLSEMKNQDLADIEDKASKEYAQCESAYAILEAILKTNYNESTEKYSIDFRSNLINAIDAYHNYSILSKEIFAEYLENLEYVKTLYAGEYYEVDYVFTKTTDVALADYYHDGETGYYYGYKVSEYYYDVFYDYVVNKIEGPISINDTTVDYLVNGEYYIVKAEIDKTDRAFTEITIPSGDEHSSFVIFKGSNYVTVTGDYTIIENEYLYPVYSDLINGLYDAIIELTIVNDGKVDIKENFMKALYAANEINRYIAYYSIEEISNIYKIVSSLLEVSGDCFEIKAENDKYAETCLSAKDFVSVDVQTVQALTYVTITLTEEGKVKLQELASSVSSLYVFVNGEYQNVSLSLEGEDEYTSLVFTFTNEDKANSFAYSATYPLQIDKENNIYSAVMQILDIALANKNEIAYVLANMLEIDVENSVAMNRLVNFVNDLIINVEYEEVDIQEVYEELSNIVELYASENAKNVMGALGVLYAVYFGEEGQSYNDMFATLPLPEGITIDYDKLIAKLQDNKTYDILSLSDAQIEYVTDSDGKLVKEILTIELSIGLDASIPAAAGFEDFVVAGLDGKITLTVELNI